VADELKTNDTEKTKRRLRKAPTIREKAEAKTKKAEKAQGPKRFATGRSFVSGFFAPLRKLGRGLKKISRYVIPPYFRNAWIELKQVTWPTFRNGLRLTGAVITFAVLFGVIVAVVDFGLDKLFKQILLK